MIRVYDKPVLIQRQNEDTEVWEDFYTFHARVNKANYKQNVNFASDADQFHARLLFEFRYTAVLEEIRYNPQIYRLVYRGHIFRAVDYDDYMEQHMTVKITGVLYEQ